MLGSSMERPTPCMCQQSARRILELEPGRALSTDRLPAVVYFNMDNANRQRVRAGRDSVPAPCAVPPPFRWVLRSPALR